MQALQHPLRCIEFSVWMRTLAYLSQASFHNLACHGSNPGRRAENENADKNPRKLIYKVEPQYPAELKRAYIGGMVRLDVMISPRGTVQTVSIAGGNPVLAECAAKAVKQWKYAPADAQTSVRLNVKFDPRH